MGEENAWNWKAKKQRFYESRGLRKRPNELPLELWYDNGISLNPLDQTFDIKVDTVARYVIVNGRNVFVGCLFTRVCFQIRQGLKFFSQFISNRGQSGLLSRQFCLSLRGCGF